MLTDLGYTVFDIISGEVEIDDVITGPLDEHGHQDLTNLKTRRTLSVYIEAIQATPTAARSLLESR